MGFYINPKGADLFARTIEDGDYVDKTGLVSFINASLGTAHNLILHSRPRCFGKSFDLMMLSCYYSRGADCRELFDELKIATDPLYEKYLNRCDLLSLYMPEFLNGCDDETLAFERMEAAVFADLLEEFSEFRHESHSSVADLMRKISRETGRKFIVLIDSWDAFFREYPHAALLHRKYRAFLASMFKKPLCSEFVLGAYLTGVLPMDHEIADFRNFTMLEPGELSDYVGFTAEEVRNVCARYALDPEQMRLRYAGYSLANGKEAFCPRAVMRTVSRRRYRNYWTETGAYSALTNYMDLNFTGLPETWATLLSGGRCFVEDLSYRKDLESVNSRDDVLTLLVHLGYLGFDHRSRCVFIPNEDIKSQFSCCIENSRCRDLMLPGME